MKQRVSPTPAFFRFMLIMVNKLILYLGPDSIEWYLIPKESIDTFNKALNELKSKANPKIPITNNFFPTINFILEHKIKCKVVIQEAMDIIVIAPGSLVFSRSKGNNLLFTWILVLNTKIQIKSMIAAASTLANEKKENNEKKKLLDFPVFNFLCQYLNRTINSISCLQFKDLELLNYYIEALNSKRIEEIEKLAIIISSIRSEQKVQAKIVATLTKYITLPSKCENEDCYSEIFQYFGTCCEHVSKILCLECSIEHIEECKFKNCFEIYNRYEKNSVETLIERIKEKIRWLIKTNQGNQGNKGTAEGFNLWDIEQAEFSNYNIFNITTQIKITKKTVGDISYMPDFVNEDTVSKVFMSIGDFQTSTDNSSDDNDEKKKKGSNGVYKSFMEEDNNCVYLNINDLMSGNYSVKAEFSAPTQKNNKTLVNNTEKCSSSVISDNIAISKFSFNNDASPGTQISNSIYSQNNSTYKVKPYSDSKNNLQALITNNKKNDLIVEDNNNFNINNLLEYFKRSNIEVKPPNTKTNKIKPNNSKAKEQSLSNLYNENYSGISEEVEVLSNILNLIKLIQIFR